MKKVIYNQEDLSDHYGVSAIIKKWPRRDSNPGLRESFRESKERAELFSSRLRRVRPLTVLKTSLDP